MIFGKKISSIEVDDHSIVALAEGTLIPISQVKDDVFAQKMMGDGVAFQYNGDRITVCAPANGILSVLFPTGHAFGITMQDGTELLVHIGIDTVQAKGEGFKVQNVRQSDAVKAGRPVVEVNLKQLSKTYDMTTMLIVTHDSSRSIRFNEETREVKRGELIWHQ